MTVYVVMYDNYERTWPSAIFAAEAAAEAYAKRRNAAAPKGEDDWSVYSFVLREDDGTTDPPEPAP